MKKTILIALAGLSLVLSGCATAKAVAKKADTAYTNVEAQHTPEEWAAYWRCRETIFREVATLAKTGTLQDFAMTIADAAADRAEYWEGK